MNDKRTIDEIDALAQEIRRVDGENRLGAGALAEALQPFLTELQHRREAEAGRREGWVLVPREPTPEMEMSALKASRACTELPDGLKPLPHGYDGWSAAFIYRAMLAASPSSPASGVRVKALEWSTDDYEDDVRAEWFAVCVVGQYLAYQRDGDWRLNLDYASGDEMIQVYIGAFETPDAAKAAAQTEYEARVLSALGEHP